MTGGKPDFLVVGAAKSGTTSLAFHLNAHPDIFMPDGEIHYFSKRWSMGHQWYLSHFNHPGSIQGEKSPTYLYYRECHPKMYRVVPRAKLVIILRDPVDRAFSNWNMRYNDKRLILQGLNFNKKHDNALKSLDFDKLADFYLEHTGSDAILSRGCHPLFTNILKKHAKKTSFWDDAPKERHQTDREWVGGATPLFEKPLDIFHRGLYIEQIESLLKYFPRRQIHIIIFERFIENRGDYFDRLYRFLGVNPIKEKTLTRLKAGTYGSPLPDEQREKLHRLYTAYNERLYDFLGFRIREWESPHGN